MNTSSKENPITNGPIFKALLALAFPMILSDSLQAAYIMADTFWVGKLGADSLAAISFSFPFMFLFIALGGGITIAGTILVAQFKGMKNQKKVDYMGSQTVGYIFIISILLGALGVILSPIILSYAGLESNVYQETTSYLRIIYFGLPLFFFYFVFQSLLRGVGNAVLPLKIVAGAVLLNLIIDPIFIFGLGPVPAMGIEGAAYATILSQGLAALVGLFLLFRGSHGITIKLPSLKPHLDTFTRFVRLGLPASIEQTSIATGLIAVSFVVASFGTEVIASYGIGVRYLALMYIPAFGLAMAITTMVGQNIGANKPKRAKEATSFGTKIGFAALTILGIFSFIFAETIATFFTTEPTVVVMATTFIRNAALLFGFISVYQSVAGAFRGAGRTTWSMIISLTHVWIFMFGSSLVLTSILGVNGIWWIFPVAFISTGIMALIWLYKSKWTEKQITEDMKF
jgi:putative MATE family efflux protein